MSSLRRRRYVSTVRHCFLPPDHPTTRVLYLASTHDWAISIFFPCRIHRWRIMRTFRAVVIQLNVVNMTHDKGRVVGTNAVKLSVIAHFLTSFRTDPSNSVTLLIRHSLIAFYQSLRFIFGLNCVLFLNELCYFQNSIEKGNT